MQPLDLNLATRPFKNNTLPWVAVGTAITALVAITVWNISTYRTHSMLVEDLKVVYSEAREELDQFERRERGAQRQIENYDVEVLTVRADKANEVIGWKAFSWTQLFNLLQEVLPNDVQMVSIRPVFRPQTPQRQRGANWDDDDGLIPVAVEGAAKNLEAFFALERALLAHPHFDRVDPEGHNQARDGSVAFQLNFLYDPSPLQDPEEAPSEEPAEVEMAQAGAAEPGDENAPVAMDGDAEDAPSPAQVGAEDVAVDEEVADDAAALDATAAMTASPVGTERGASALGTTARGAPETAPDPEAAEDKPGPTPPAGRKGKRRLGGRGTEKTP
jgi:hypothetical protein